MSGLTEFDLIISLVLCCCFFFRGHSFEHRVRHGINFIRKFYPANISLFELNFHVFYFRSNVRLSEKSDERKQTSK